MADTTNTPPAYMDKVADELSRGEEPHLLTGDQYLRSLDDGRRVVAADGTEVENVVEHPATAAAARTFAEVMDLQFDPEHRDSVTYVDEESGHRKALGWQVPTTREHLYAKMEQISVSTRKTLGMFGRPPDYGPAMSLGFLGIIDHFERDNPQYADNIRNFVRNCGDHNLLSTDLIADAQSDRTVPRNDRPGTLRIVDEDDDGIVLRGSKIAGSGGPLSHFYTLSTVLGEGLGPDAAIWAAVPVNIPGLSLVMREPTVRPDVTREDHPVNSHGEEMDQILVFDDVRLPREYIFSIRDLESLKLYFESVAYVCWHIMTRLAYRAKIFAGTAQVVTEILGTDKIPGVRKAVTEITTYAETLRAFSIASIAQSETWNGVAVPHPGLVTAGRLHSIQQYPRIVYTLQDLCGQGLISRWPEKIWDHPEFGPKLEQFLPGHGVSAREKNSLFNFVWDLTSSGNAGRVGLFENVNATPPSFISELVYMYVDRSEMSSFVRDYVGLPPASPA